MQTSLLQLSALQQRLLHSKDKALQAIALVGFDGFVDSIQKAVNKRNGNEVSFFKTIDEFSTHLKSLSGKSGQVELIIKQLKMGGNAPILANALGCLGVHGTCVGAMGFPDLHTVFKDIHPHSTVLSISEPGVSNAIEFEDGKIILSHLSVFDTYDWNHIRNSAKFTDITNAISKSNLLAFVDWVNLPQATSIWRGVLHDCIAPTRNQDRIFLFDLCDPSKKSRSEIREVAELISSFSTYGRVVLGLNENEATILWHALCEYDYTTISGEPIVPVLDKMAEAIFNSMNLDILLIHPKDRTLVIQKNRKPIELTGYTIREPKVLTGGGDNLNAGFCWGLLNKFSTEECMILGMAASGSYIKNGVSPSVDDLMQYLNFWSGQIELRVETLV